MGQGLNNTGHACLTFCVLLSGLCAFVRHVCFNVQLDRLLQKQHQKENPSKTRQSLAQLRDVSALPVYTAHARHAFAHIVVCFTGLALFCFSFSSPLTKNLQHANKVMGVVSLLVLLIISCAVVVHTTGLTLNGL